MRRETISLFLIVMALFAGCGSKAQPISATVGGSSVRETLTAANPKEAVEDIYESLAAYEAEPLKFTDLRETLGIEASNISEYYGKISDPNEGLADVLILLPKEQAREKVSLALSKYKETRMASFENYDILDAYSISQNAVIYEQGGYIIMLMLLDNDAARAIIDEYIPL